MGPLANSNTKYLKGANPYWNINLDHPNYDAFWQARSIWKHFKAIKPAVLTVGGWYDAEDLQGPLRTYQTIEQTSPGATNTIVMGPWTHGSWSRGAGDKVGPGHLRSEGLRVVSRARRVPVLRQAPQGARDRAGARSADVRHRAERVATPRDVAAQGRAEEDALSGSRWLARLAGAGGRWLRRVRQRPRQARAACGLHGAEHAVQLHDGRPALRRAAAGRAGLSDTDACRGRDDRRPDRGRLARLDDRHRRGLRRQAHRRLSGRPSRHPSSRRMRPATR